jgi:hypothetical protein
VLIVVGIGVWALFLSGLVDGRALSDTVIVGFPDDIGIWREGEKTLYGFSAWEISTIRFRDSEF